VTPSQPTPPKSWSSLVGVVHPPYNPTNNFPISSGQSSSISVPPSILNKQAVDNEIIDAFLKSVKTVNISEKPVSLIPCGLVNSDNKCFMNVILQTLISSSPFLNLLTSFQKSKISNQNFPYTKKFVDFSMQYQKVGNSLQNNMASFAASEFIESLKQFYTSGIDMQEDAQEYLTFLLNNLDTELRIVNTNVKKNSPVPQDDDDPWITKGKKKNVVDLTEVLIEKSSNNSSVISQIFGGQLQSVVSKKNLPSSSSSEPCFCIPLDIFHNSITSLESALNLYTAKENIEYSGPQNKSIIANKQTKIEKAPLILIFHLKRFTHGNEKLGKNITYPKDLYLAPQWCSANFDNQKRNYQLCSVVCHHGEETKGGHYTNYSFNHYMKAWYHYDDRKATKVDLKRVLNADNAYLLFYCRI